MKNKFQRTVSTAAHMLVSGHLGCLRWPEGDSLRPHYAIQRYTARFILARAAEDDAKTVAKEIRWWINYKREYFKRITKP